MHWILQNNLFNEDGMNRLLHVLCGERYTFSVHKVVPFVGEITPDISPEGRVICMGSHSLRLLARKKGWTPGVMDIEHIKQEDLKNGWGRELLNYYYKLQKFSDIDESSSFFVRPDSDQKLFSGMLVEDLDKFKVWQKDVVKLGVEPTGSGLTRDTLCVISTPKEIYKEIRFWIVNNQIVTASQYKIGDRVLYSDQVDPDAFEYVERRLECWIPAKAFVMDIALTEWGYKIIELNTLNSSGFYSADIDKLVYALGNLY